MMSQEQLMQLLSNMHSSENELRRVAEAEYENIIQTQPSWMMHALVEVCATTQDTAVATMTLILLRKLFNMESNPFENADAATQNAVKTRLLQVLGTAAFGPQRGSTAACVSALAVKVYKLKQDWTELWENIFKILGAAESANELKTMCCEIISATAVTMCDYFRIHADALVAGLHNCLKTGNDAKVLQNAAFETVIKLAPLDFKKKLNPLVPVMLNVIQERLNAQDWDTAETLTSCIAEGISEEVELFEGHTIPLLTGMMQVASTPSVHAGARHMAIEVLLTYCETEPKLVRKVPEFATSFFELLFQYTLHPMYDDDWDVTDMKKDEDELEEDSDQTIGSSGLDRIALALRGRKLQSTAKNLFTQNVRSTDWKARNAAVLLVCYIAEGMSSVFKSELSNLVGAVVPLVNDPVKYVRASALDCLSQFSVDFAPILQQKEYKTILPCVIAAVQDPVPHVACCAARCIDSFFDSILDDDDNDDTDAMKTDAEGKHGANDVELENLEDVECYAPYVPQVCEYCVRLLQSTQLHFVRESALGALSSLTSTCKSLLTPYVNILAPVYQQILDIPDSAEVMSTKCKAIECVTLLACGVGKEVFAPYSQSVCDYLTRLCANGLRNDDSRFRFVLRGWTCMVECLHGDVLPYLQPVMQMLLAMMNLECDVVVVNAAVGEEDDDHNTHTAKSEGNNKSNNTASVSNSEGDVETCRFIVPGVGEKVARFHTGLIEDKELASNVVNAMLQELGILLSPYFNDIAKSALELLKFTVNSSIRENGALILKEIIDACEEHQAPESQQLAMVALGPLVIALAEETESEVMESMMEVIAGCISIYPAVINPENVTMVSDKLLATLQVMIKSRAECIAKKKTENDEDELDALEEEDEELQSNIRSAFELIGTLLEKTSSIFAPLFMQHFFPFVSAWLQPQEDDFNVTRAMAIVCDFVENAPQYVTNGLSMFCSAATQFASTRTDEDLLQTCFYLMNLLAQYFACHPELSMGNVVDGVNAQGATNAVNVNDFILHAHHVISVYLSNSNVALSEEYEHCTCNALSTYVTLLHFYGQSVLHPHAGQMLTTIIGLLPASADVTEAVRVHDRVLGWIHESNPLLTLIPNSAHTILMKLKSAKPYYFSEAAREALKAM